MRSRNLAEKSSWCGCSKQRCGCSKQGVAAQSKSETWLKRAAGVAAQRVPKAPPQLVKLLHTAKKGNRMIWDACAFSTLFLLCSFQVLAWLERWNAVLKERASSAKKKVLLYTACLESLPKQQLSRKDYMEVGKIKHG